MFALLVPAPTSGPASSSAQRAPRRVSSRATAQPTAPAPTTATSKGPSGAGPSRSERSPTRRAYPGIARALSSAHGPAPDRSLRRGRAGALRRLEGRAGRAAAALLRASDPGGRRDARRCCRPTGAPTEDPGELLDRIDALVLGGGADIDPESHGVEAHPETVGTNPDRDRFEIALALRGARARDPAARGLPRDAGPQRRLRRNARPAPARPARPRAPPADSRRHGPSTRSASSPARWRRRAAGGERSPSRAITIRASTRIADAASTATRLGHRRRERRGDRVGRRGFRAGRSGTPRRTRRTGHSVPDRPGARAGFNDRTSALSRS